MTSPDADTPAASSDAGRPPRSQRGNPSFGDVVRSVAVMVAVVLALFFVGKLLLGRSADPPATVDYKTPLGEARRAAPFPLLAPTALPSKWRATTVSYDPGLRPRWHLGVLTDEDKYVGLEQANLSTSTMIDRFSPDTSPRGRTQVGGATWLVRTSDRGETTLVRRADGATILVTGRAPRAQLEKYAASLRAR